MKRKALFTAAVILSLTLFSACAGGEKSADVHVFYYTYSDTYITSVITLVI